MLNVTEISPVKSQATFGFARKKAKLEKASVFRQLDAICTTFSHYYIF
jgi:hypothetical protein